MRRSIAWAPKAEHTPNVRPVQEGEVEVEETGEVVVSTCTCTVLVEYKSGRRGTRGRRRTDVRVVEQAHEADLAVDLLQRGRVQLRLVDDLDGHVAPGEQVLCELHARKVPLAERPDEPVAPDRRAVLVLRAQHPSTHPLHVHRTQPQQCTTLVVNTTVQFSSVLKASALNELRPMA